MSLFLLNQESEEEVDNPSEIETKTTITLPTMLNISGNVNEAQDALNNFWPKVTEEIRNIRQLDLKNQALPLARIKKIMKLDEGVKMISAEAPMLFSKAAELFINELTLRAWIHTEDNKRRTLQRNDIAMAITKYDMFDFLIDIVPREEVKPAGTNNKREDTKAALNPDQVQYYFQLAQQTALQTGAGTSSATPTLVVNGGNNEQGQPQIIQLGNTTNAAANASAASANQGIQIVQQVLSPNGEIQQIPLQLTAAQLAMIRASGNQPITLITQAAPGQAQQIIQVAGSTSSGQN